MNVQKKIKISRQPAAAAAVRKGVVLFALPMSAQTARAQTSSDMSSIYSGIAFSVASLVVLILVGVLFRRFSSRRKNDLAEGAGLDLMTLRQKNLLTPDEMKMVSAAIARRMAEKDSRQKKTGAGLSTATLLHDPEVMRLQELAQAQREAARQSPTAEVPNPAATERASEPAAEKPLEGTPPISAVPDHPTAPATPASMPIPPPANVYEHAGDPIGLGNPIDLEDYARDRAPAADRELPPEVQKLADAGLLTDEEIEKIRQRLKGG